MRSVLLILKSKENNDNLTITIDDDDDDNNDDCIIIEESSDEAKKVRSSLGDSKCSWTVDNLISESVLVSPNIARNVIKLLDQECTIPFIARYRREQTGDIPVEKLREIQETYETVKLVQKKSKLALHSLAKEDKLTPSIAVSLLNAKSLSEIELICAPFKTGGKKTLAERARKLGLEESAVKLLNGDGSCSMFIPNIMNPDIKGLTNKEEIKTGWQHIIADIIAKDRDVLDTIRKICEPSTITLHSTKSAAAEKNDKKAFVEGTETKNYKFEIYFDFTCSAKNIKPHQVLALNRGEHLKILSVKVSVNSYAKNEIIKMIKRKFLFKTKRDNETFQMISNCIDDSYKRLIEAYICRQTRSDLTKKAEKESILVFCTNLKHLLLTQPVKGKVVMGIDPGFRHGCKLAVVSSKGTVLETSVIYPFDANKSNVARNILKQLIEKHGCEILAIGNGTACRDTENFLSGLISKNAFHPLQIKYCIVNEHGVSIYSVTKEAAAELPGMDPNVRSAVSIARRLQDPLLEYIKVEPKHLGIGMYQHDIPEKMLKNALNEVVIECTSFVGIDLNVCTEQILSKIAGLTPAKAKNIIKWRTENGPFQNRLQLNCVRGLGPKSFEQCAGFVKILPETCMIDHSNDIEIIEIETDTRKRKSASKTTKSRKKMKLSIEINPLDMTVIHPESYDTAERFLKKINANAADIGKSKLIEKIKELMNNTNIEQLSNEFSVCSPTMQLIVDALSQLLEYDIRSGYDKPMFKSGVMSINDITCGEVLTGKVINVTHFGAFVDIGLEISGLVHVSKMGGKKLSLGNQIKVKVISVDLKKRRIGLQFIEQLQ
ncbi:S1 RNA-binding domain-containing protein 1-like [Centruroides sculpturatus]|uniref:S1 RNA-binding domain-containing protein 1-like n=1 Tax=Centruroides sculpturatus TaxID=218467 RepID=UPI000C6E691B|nr:S1 RNA-binding domain-containing protein 1-like [Centruroides sculpturatus]